MCAQSAAVGQLIQALDDQGKRNEEMIADARGRLPAVASMLTAIEARQGGLSRLVATFVNGLAFNLLRATLWVLLILWSIFGTPIRNLLWKPVTMAINMTGRIVKWLVRGDVAQGRQGGSAHLEGQAAEDGSAALAEAGEQGVQAKEAQEQADADASAKIDRMKRKRHPSRFLAQATGSARTLADAPTVPPLSEGHSRADVPGGVAGAVSEKADGAGSANRRQV